MVTVEIVVTGVAADNIGHPAGARLARCLADLAEKGPRGLLIAGFPHGRGYLCRRFPYAGEVAANR